MSKGGKLIVFSAPRDLENNDSQTSTRRFEFRILHFSFRESRGEEANGKDYYFISTEEFKQHIKNDDFLKKFTETISTELKKSEVDRIWAKGKNVILILTLLVDCESNLNFR
jgi:guanylate kinase